MRDTGASMLLAAGTTLLLVAAVGCAVESPTVGQVQNDPDRPGSSSCPNGSALGNFLPAGNVAAGFSNNDHTTTYWFASLANEDPAGGVPGLIRYCVYTNSATNPTAIDVQATGANGAPWTFRASSGDFSFGRPAGNPSNIPLDGSTTTIGTATWDAVPSDQTILLHINDPLVCDDLYGNDPGTCFVTSAQASACVLDIGETNVAYNAMPFGAAACARSSLGFEATQTTEFGDEVQLGGTARQLASLKVLFSSWACEAGHWFDNTCATTPGATFTHPVTANIYAVADCGGTPCLGALLATVTETETVPYRPSADPVCTGGDLGEWFNTVAGLCRPQISVVLTFTFSPGVTLPDRVIWAVAFNTTHYGTPPIGEAATCFTASGGCPYDSFNVGAETFPGAPYAGSDVVPDEAWLNGVPDAGWTNFKPLGEIITTP